MAATKGHWIAGAVKRPGQLHRDLGVPQGQPIPQQKVEVAAHSRNPALRARAQFALNVRGLGKGKKGR